jgi:CheY-like chemotaxis protein
MGYPKHICFIDDDPDEIATFERLYHGDTFSVTSILAQDASKAASKVDKALGGATPDLFVLDLYFPLSSDSPTSLLDAAGTTQDLDRLNDSIQELRSSLEASRAEGKQLLRLAHVVVNRSRRLLDNWCKQLNQSPQGGIELIRRLNTSFPRIPKVFYSRKATLQDAKEAIAEGAIDVLLKPDPSLEESQATDITQLFMDYCQGKTPSFLSKWLDKGCLRTNDDVGHNDNR